MRDTCGLCGEPRNGSHITYCRRCYNAYKRRWYLSHRAGEIARCAAYNKANPNIPAASMQRCREKRPDFYREYTRKYQRRNTDRMAVYWSKSGAKKRAAKLGQPGLTVGSWRAIKEFFSHACAYCGHKPKKLTQDHVVPISKGGVHDSTNIIPACFRCNSSKGSKDVYVFLARRNLACSPTLAAWLNARRQALQK